MSKVYGIFLLAGLTGCMSMVEAKPAQSVSVIPICVSQTKAILLGRDKATFGPYVLEKSLLEVRLEVITRAIHNPLRCKALRITAAMYNNGTSIMPSRDHALHHDVFIPAHMRYAMQAAGDLGFPVALDFSPPLQPVQRIAMLQGSFVVIAGGSVRTFWIKNVQNLLGKDVISAQLMRIGIRVHIKKLLQRPNGKPEKLLWLKLVGRSDLISAAVVQDLRGAGKGAGQSQIVVHSSHSLLVGVPLYKPLSAFSVIKLKLRVDEKRFRVPFALKNLLLPQ